MSNTTVGTVSYDVRLNLAQLKKDSSQAEKIVKDSYSRMAKSQKSASGGGSSGAKTQAEAITKTTQAQVEATKSAAQESYNAISKYAPQIQRQFLSVERANNQVYAASVRSALAIQKYGSDSTQAARATGALNVAVQNQAIAQSRLDSSLTSTNKSLSISRSSMIALGAAAIGVGLAVGNNLGAAIDRSDTINNFPKVMSNLKISAQESKESINLLADNLKGLPTSLDTAARAVQRFTTVNRNVKASTALFLGVNNAIIAGGASMDIQATALEQLSQGYAKGRLDMVEWRAILTAMPAQLQQVAEAFGLASADQLGESLRDQTISMDQFLQKIAQLNSEGANGYLSFADQAKNSTDGIRTSITNMNTAIQRSITSIIDSIGRDNISNAIQGVGSAFETTARAVGFLLNVTRPLAPALTVATVGIATMALAQGALTGATILGTRALAAFRTMLTFISKHPIIAVLSILAGVIGAVATSIGIMNNETQDTGQSSDDLAESLKGYEPPIRAATDAAKDLGKQMAKIDDQIAKANEDYRYNLAQLVADKNKNIATLQDTLRDEKRSYDNAYAERLASFEKSQNDEEQSHSEKTKALQNQIDFLSKYNTAANNAQVSELQFALAQENAAYQKATGLREQEFAKQTESAMSEYEKRRLENQKKLDEELSLLNKHRDEVLGIRGVILRDEIEALQYSRNEQLKSLQQQRNDIIENLGSAYNAAGGVAAREFKSSFVNATANTPLKLQLVKGKPDKDGNLSFTPTWVGSFAKGGFTGKGAVNEEAGIVHKGEYVLPQSMVDQNTGMPDMSKMGGGQKIEVNINMSGVMASGKADMRRIANEFGKLINETVVARTGKTAIVGL